MDWMFISRVIALLLCVLRRRDAPKTLPRRRARAGGSAAAELSRQRGYAATGINDILGLAAAPKGSFYHYFPGGKEALGAEAIRYARRGWQIGF